MRCHISPAKVAPLLPDYPEWEIAEEMVRACIRLDDDVQERRLRQKLSKLRDVPIHLRPRSEACIQQARHIR